MPKKRYYDGHYESMGDGRSQERADGGMISKDMSKQANMPQNVIMRLYPGRTGSLPASLDDTMKGIDKQMTKDSNKMRSEKSNRKF